MACYDVPQPVCGFVCGAGGACPDDYTCNPADNRCHLNGSPPTTCPGGADAGIDTPDGPGIDMGVNTPPSVVSTTPADLATGVAVTTTVSATFSEEVFGINGGSFSLAQGVQQVAATVSYASGASPVATLTPTAQLAPNTTYTATLMNSIVDSGGASLPQKTWTFTTAADTTAPTVTARTPMPGATAVATSSTVTAQFSENVMGVSGTTFTLADGGTPIAGTVTYAAGTRTATFTPAAALPQGTLLTATLTSGITDTSGNALSGAPVTWTFTTASDTTAPTVMTRTPGPGATMVSTATTIVVLFSEPVMGVTTTSFTVNDGAAVTGTLASAMSGREWTFTPAAPLAANTAVTVNLTTAIADLAGNALAAPVTWMFMTAPDTTAPTVTMRTPAPNATMVATSTTIVATFSEPVMGVTTST
ncbi:MAG: Ig-like domain-containing protein, partial [Myxococcales bacterium]|nr:Ig-like domain-containing protein [Myxococcales bacterium]